MPTACVVSPDCRVQLESERLIIQQTYAKDASLETALLREIPLRDVERVLLVESCSITSPALAELMKRQIPVGVLAKNGTFLGAFTPTSPAHGAARLLHYRRSLEPEFNLQIASRIVSAKLYNQRRVLQRISAGRDTNTSEDPETTESSNQEPNAAVSTAQTAVTWMANFFSSIRNATTLEEIRGYEGAATARYFQAWAQLLPPQFPFERRSTRPPLNPVNACVSFGATLLYHEMVSACHARGLDPAIGSFHTTEDGRWSLALDLMEPFRPALVEALTLDLFSRNMVDKLSFEKRNGGVYLNDVGRRKFIFQYERRMERQFMSEAVGHRTCLRQQLDQQALMFKASLDDINRFDPFVMN